MTPVYCIHFVLKESMEGGHTMEEVHDADQLTEAEEEQVVTVSEDKIHTVNPFSTGCYVYTYF